MIGQRNMLCGMHVHVELPDPDERVDVMCRMLPYLPLFLALSTSSPFWQSRRTGLKGYRLAAYDELPRTGVPELFRTKEEFDAYVAALVRAGVMEDSSYVWWAIRPSLNHPTLELRAPDCCTLVDDTIAIAALYRTLARHLYHNPWRNADINAVSRAIVVENKWRAQRYGVHGTFVTEEGAVTVGEMLDRVIEETHDGCRRAGCTDEIRRCRAIVGAGTSADAQLAVFEAHKDGENREQPARRHRLDRQRDVAVELNLSIAATASRSARPARARAHRPRRARAARTASASAPARAPMPASSAVGRKRSDQALDQRADQRRRRDGGVLIGQMAAGERRADARFERARQRPAVGDAARHRPPARPARRSARRRAGGWPARAPRRS